MAKSLLDGLAAIEKAWRSTNEAAQRGHKCSGSEMFRVKSCCVRHCDYSLKATTAQPARRLGITVQ